MINLEDSFQYQNNSGRILWARGQVIAVTQTSAIPVVEPNFASILADKQSQSLTLELQFL